MRFCEDRRGNVAMTSAGFLMAMAMVIAATVELARMASMKDGLQRALDAGILAAARLQDADDATRSALAQQFVDANLDDRFAGLGVTVAVHTNPDTGGLSATADVQTRPGFASLSEVASLPINVDSETRYAARRKLELALVLDTTGSMDGDKLATLKTAATNLVNAIMLDGDDSVRVSVVPFARYVNVGLQHRNHFGIDAPADDPGREVCTTRVEYSGCYYEPYSCRFRRRWFTCYRRVCSTSQTITECETVDQRAWNGCVGSREAPRNTDILYPGTGVPGLLDITCSNPVTRLTSTKSTVRNAITALQASGATYIPSGLSWGWRALDHGHPFPDGADNNVPSEEQVVKAIVLMTDGANTRSKSESSAYHNAYDVSDANAITSSLCTNVKAAGVDLYTIAFEVTDLTIQSLLQTCASEVHMHHNAANASALVQAFDDVARDLTALHISR